MGRPRYPDDHEPTVTWRPAVGRFDDVQTVLGIANREVGACWCMSYRDARLKNPQRAEFMERLCAGEPGPGILVYVDDEPAGWCSIAPREQYRRLLHSRTIPIIDDLERVGFEKAADTTAHSGGRDRVIMRKYLRRGAKVRAKHRQTASA